MQHSLLNLLGEKNYGGQTVPQKRIGRNLVDFPKEFVILDIETTGLSPHRDEIIELSALLIRNDEIVEEFNRLVKPEGEISAFISNLTGITPEMVADAPDIATAIKDFDDFCAGKSHFPEQKSFPCSFCARKSLRFQQKLVRVAAAGELASPSASMSKLF